MGTVSALVSRRDGRHAPMMRFPGVVRHHQGSAALGCQALARIRSMTSAASSAASIVSSSSEYSSRSLITSSGS
jgi:hypothetical protein